MMYIFLENNRHNLIERCRVKVAARPARNATEQQLEQGVPIFIDQLIRTLTAEQSAHPDDGVIISGTAGAGPDSRSEIGDTASQHGKALLELGFSVDQVVHDYGDICQAITDLAYERDAPFAVEEFRTLNRCLDNAIADAVTEFTYQRDFLESNKQADAMNERLGTFAHELRNLLGTATLAFAAAKTGQMNLNGSTGAILERSLIGLRTLVDRSLADVRHRAVQVLEADQHLTLFDLSALVDADPGDLSDDLRSKLNAVRRHDVARGVEDDALIPGRAATAACRFHAHGLHNGGGVEFLVGKAAGARQQEQDHADDNPAIGPTGGGRGGFRRAIDA